MKKELLSVIGMTLVCAALMLAVMGTYRLIGGRHLSPAPAAFKTYSLSQRL